MSSSPASVVQAANAVILLNGDLDAIPDFFAPGYVAHGIDGDLNVGHESIRRFLQMIRKAFPDLELEVQFLVESDDRVAWVRRLEGTQKGGFMGFPATGRRVVWRDMITSRIEDGRIAEEWVLTDLAERLLRARKGSRAPGDAIGR